MQSRNLQVGSIQCTQSGISVNFRDGNWVGNLINDIRDKHVHPSDLQIRVIEVQRGVYFCLDHRRMWAVREALPNNFWFKVLIDQNFEEFERKHTGNGCWPEFIWPEENGCGNQSDDGDGSYHDDDCDCDQCNNNNDNNDCHDEYCDCDDCNGYNY